MALLERARLRALAAPAADLKLARMANAEFEECRFPFANLSSADLTRSLWIRCILNDASLASANLCESVFQTVHLQRCARARFALDGVPPVSMRIHRLGAASIIFSPRRAA